MTLRSETESAETGSGRRGARSPLSPRATSALLLSPMLLLLGPGFLFPLAGVLTRSFTEPTVGLDNYQRAAESEAFRSILTATFSIAAWTTVVCLLMAYPLAYWMTTLRPRWRRVVLLIVLAPLFMAILARLYAWTIILGRRGVVNSGLESLGVAEPMDLLFNRFAVTLGMVHVLLPYMVIVLYTVMVAIPPDLMQAARSLGAAPWRAFRRVYLPLTMSGVFSGSLLVFVMAIGFFTTPAVLGGGRVVTIPIYIERQMAVLSWGPAATSAMILLIVSLILFALFNRTFGTQRIVVGGSRL